MKSFGRKLKELREDKGFSQSKLAKLAGLHHSIIGRYERDDAKPTIDVAKKMANALETTVSYLLGETEDMSVLKNPEMLQRLKDIDSLTEKDKQGILFALDGLLRDAKTRKAYAV